MRAYKVDVILSNPFNKFNIFEFLQNAKSTSSICETSTDNFTDFLADIWFLASQHNIRKLFGTHSILQYCSDVRYNSFAYIRLKRKLSVELPADLVEYKMLVELVLCVCEVD